MPDNGFLPEGYEAPKVIKPSYFFKPDGSKVQVRVTQLPEFIWAWWNQGKSFRKRTKEEFTVPKGAKEKPKHGWVLKVLNRTTESVQLWEVKGETIVDLTDLVNDPRCGSLLNYDLVVWKDGGKTMVRPCPPQPLSQEDIELRDSMELDMEAVLRGTGVPFKSVGE